MYLKQFYDPYLSQYSYIIGCQIARTAIVIDPLRDIGQYLSVARSEGYNIVAATETHIHADFLSGCKQLAETEAVKLYLSEEGGSDWQYKWVRNLKSEFQLVKNDDVITIGNVEVMVIHTPGHTPEHISFLITDTSVQTSIPMGIVTGDFVFVGDLGRPDLLESVVGIEDSSVVSAGQLFDSVKAFLQYPDYLQVWPGHGVGSACGKEMGAVPESTVGYERRLNQSIFAISRGKESFINSILADQGDPPLYFKNMKYINRDTGAEKTPDLLTAPLNLTEVTKLLEDNSIIILDTREDRADFMKRHLSGSIYIALNKSFPKSAGSYLQPDDKIVVMVDDFQQYVAVHKTLTRIGIDNIIGHILLDELDQLQPESEILSTIKVITFDRLQDTYDNDNCIVIDVRYSHMHALNHVPNAANIYYTNLPNRLEDLPRDQTIIVHCTLGNSAAGASSFLNREGFDVIYVNDEWVHYEEITKTIENSVDDSKL